MIKRMILMLVLMFSTGAQAFETPEITLNPTVGPVACPYTTFSTASLFFPDRPNDSTVNSETHKALERRYAEELKRVGWREVSPEHDPAFMLTATLARSSLAPTREVAVGAIALLVTSTTHRDGILAEMEGYVKRRRIMGLTAPIEVAIKDEDVAKHVRAAIEKHANYYGTHAWEVSKKAIRNLCSWRESLGKEGIAIEELREALIREMLQVRERAKQRKRLSIEVEDR